MALLQLKPEAEAAGGVESRPQHQERTLEGDRIADLQTSSGQASYVQRRLT